MRRGGLLLALLLLGAGATLAQKPAQPTKPRVPPGMDPGGIAVALIASGVNYTLPSIARRLARDGEGDLLGLDFEDRDNRPFERPETVSGAPPAVQGSALASLLLAEAPGARIVPVRAKSGDPRSLAGAIAFAAAGPARVAVITQAGGEASAYEPMRMAAGMYPGVLLILPAGDGNQDLDAEPLYPPALGLANAIVVAAANATSELLATSGHGARTVDVAIAAEGLEVTAADGSAALASGSAYAAVRVAAIAARLLAREPGLEPAALKSRILAMARPMPASSPRRVRVGVIDRGQTHGSESR